MGYKGKYFIDKDGKLYKCIGEVVESTLTEIVLRCIDDDTVRYCKLDEVKDFMTLAEGEYFHVEEENLKKLWEVIIPRGDCPCILDIDDETKICLQILLDNQRIEIGDYFYSYCWKGGWVMD